MDNAFYLDLAGKHGGMPVGTDLVLHEQPDPQAVKMDGGRLGAVIVEAASRYRTPVAMPLMDLMLEKRHMLRLLGIPEDQIPTWHFPDVPTAGARARIREGLTAALDPQLQAHVDSISHVARTTSLHAVGMSIGPFSLATKLLGDPITPVYLSGMGMTANDEPDVARLDAVLELAFQTVMRSLEAQIAAGAQSIFIAEPAGNKVFFSPNQLEAGADIFERYVIQWNRRIAERLRAAGVHLLFHCCGELVDPMVQAYGRLGASLISLGSSRDLVHDAGLLPENIVLYGNLPSKKFYSDELISADEVRLQSAGLRSRMRACGHPFILGTECDVLSVPGSEAAIMAKVEAFMKC